VKEKICIGLTGRMASGKGEAIRILTHYGFHAVSLSDIVRAEAKKEGQEISRSQMQDIGDRLRRQDDAGILGRRIREKIETSAITHWVIDGIRNPDEVAELKHLSRFYLVGIEADIPVILKRLRNRGRETDRLETEELLRALEREWGIGEPDNGQQVGPCMALSDFLIGNNSTLKALERKIKDVLNEIGATHEGKK
jgi:dephospho-CoA kinase